MAIMTSDQLLVSIKRGISLPQNQNRFSDEDLLAFADEELATLVMPEMVNLREEFGVYNELIPLVANQSKYQIPSRAIGRVLRDLQIQTSSTTTLNLAYITPADNSYFTNQNVSGFPTGFYFENDKVVLLPAVTSNPVEVLVARFIMRHSKLVKVSAARTVTNINTVTNEVTISSAFDVSVQPGSAIDFVKSTSQPVILAWDQPIMNISTATLTFASIPADLKLGDYVSLAETTPVLQLPEETHQVVAQAVQVRVLEAQGDYDALKQSQDKLQKKINSMRQLLQPRIEGETQVVIQRNGLLNRGRRFGLMRNLRL